MYRLSHVMLIIALFLGISAGLGAQPSQDSYHIWLTVFLEKLNQSGGAAIMDSEKLALQDLLAAKPTYQSGAEYGFWLDKAFTKYFKEASFASTEFQLEKLAFVVAAIPDVTSADAHFAKFFKFILPYLRSYTVSPGDNEQRFVEVFRQVRPPSKATDYQLWFSEYNRLKAAISPDSSNDDHLVLAFMRELMPAQGTTQKRTYQISEDALLRIRQYILDQQSMKAVQEIDSIFSAGQ